MLLNASYCAKAFAVLSNNAVSRSSVLHRGSALIGQSCNSWKVPALTSFSMMSSTRSLSTYRGRSSKSSFSPSDRTNNEVTDFTRRERRQSVHRRTSMTDVDVGRSSRRAEPVQELHFKSEEAQEEFLRGVPVFHDNDNDIEGDDGEFDDKFRANKKTFQLAKRRFESKHQEDRRARGLDDLPAYDNNKRNSAEKPKKRFIRESLSSTVDGDDFEDDVSAFDGNNRTQRDRTSRRVPVTGHVEKRIQERMSRQRDSQFNVESMLSPSKSALNSDNNNRRRESDHSEGNDDSRRSRRGSFDNSNNYNGNSDQRMNRRDRRMSRRESDDGSSRPQNNNRFEDEDTRRFYAKKLHKDWRIKREASAHLPAVTTIRDFDGDHLFGMDPIKLALKANRRVCVELLMQQEMDLEHKRNSHDAQEIIALAKEKNLKITEVSKHDLNMISENRPHQGFILRAKPLRMQEIDSLEKSDKYQVVLALDELWDPQNFGALLRTSHFLGVDKVVVCAKNSAPLNAVVSKTSAGAMELQPVFETDNMMRFLDGARANGWRVIGTALDKQAIDVHELVMKDHQQQDQQQQVDRQPTVLVLGNEGHGIRTNVLKRCDVLVQIAPGHRTDAHIDSLNVSVCGGILLHHLLRQ